MLQSAHGMCLSFWNRVLFFLILRSEIAESYGSIIFNFLKNPGLFFMVTAPIYIPTNSVSRFPFAPHPCQYLLSFDNSPSDRCEVISHCGFNLNFPDDWYVEHLFMCLLAI